MVPVRRKPTKTTKGAKERRLTTKKRRAVIKATRGRHSGEE